jgi:DNA-3-methyladenine glycosylase II
MNTNISPQIINHLKKDKTLALIIDNCLVSVQKEPKNVFDDLLRSIVSQQLSTSAAAIIYGRFIASLDKSELVGKQILNKSIIELRACGLSNAKANYIKNVVSHFDGNDLYDTDWSSWSDEDIIHELSKIKGVGKWTAEMILMFSLFREDVLPLDDLIIRNNITKLYNVQSEKKQLMSDLTVIAEKWRPYRSYACLYLWAAKDSKFLKP